MTVFGYVKKNYFEGIEEQIEKLQKCQCTFFFIESDPLNQRAKEMEMISALKENDTVVATDFRIFDKTLIGFYDFFTKLTLKNVQLIIVNNRFDSRQPLLFQESLEMMMLLDKSYKNKHKKSSGGSLDSEHRPWGRPAISDEKVAEIKKLYASKKMSMRAIAAQCEVSLGTVHKYLKSEDDALSSEGEL